MLKSNNQQSSMQLAIKMKLLFVFFLLPILTYAQFAKSEAELVAKWGQPDTAFYITPETKVLQYYGKIECPEHGAFTQGIGYYLSTNGECYLMVVTIRLKEKHYWVDQLNKQYMQESDSSWVSKKGRKHVSLFSKGEFVEIQFSFR